MSSATGNDIQAAYGKAMALMKSGQGEAALAAFTNIVMMRPKTVEAHFQIGNIHSAAGRTEKAQAAFRKALALRPGEQAIWQALTAVTPVGERDALMAEIAGHLTGADQARLGASLRGEGRVRAADAVLRGAVKAGAETARIDLAKLLLATCRPDDAEKLLAKAKGKDANLWRTLAQARAQLRRPGPARQAMASAIAAGTGQIDGLFDLAMWLWKEEEVDAALSVLDDAIARAPGIAALVGQRGEMAQSLGRFDDANADLLRAIELDPSDGEAYRAYVSGQKIAEGDPVVEQIEAALTRSDLKPRSRWRFHFAMAKALSDLGRHDEVFTHLHAGNGLQRKAYPYDFEAAVKSARDRIAAFREHLAGKPVAGTPGKAIFVTGPPRSGTTLVENIFAAHPDVTAGGELSFFGDAMAPLFDAIGQGAAIAPQDLARPGALYLTAARRRSGARKIFTDKAIGTFARIGFAAYALPEARFFVMKREPRDVALSCYRNLFADGVQRFSNDLYDIGRYLRLQEAMVAAWQELLPDRINTVDYADLTAEPEPHIRQMVAAAGLDWDDACLAPHKADRKVHTLSFAQVRAPIYQSSVSGWRRYEAELEPLERGLAEPIDLM